MITVALVCAFIVRYYSNEDPPIYDIISPLVTLSILTNLITMPLTIVTPMVLVVITLGLEAVADFYMNKDRLRLSIGLFSNSHLIRQFSFLKMNGFKSQLTIAGLLVPNGDIIATIITTIITILLAGRLRAMRPGSNISFFIIGCYSFIIFLSAVQVSMVQNSISYGYVVFIISDLIIGYDLIIGKIKPRWLRIIGVPVLYWSAQYLLTYECLNLLSNIEF